MSLFPTSADQSNELSFALFFSADFNQTAGVDNSQTLSRYHETGKQRLTNDDASHESQLSVYFILQQINQTSSLLLCFSLRPLIEQLVFITVERFRETMRQENRGS
ncbi:hypothetical protein Nepgr_005917 [Nepenthes gracilis]|uniref:Uncharacterized protein n=1 Tax=Nepenthes gracilis TaxID=150966 RepID=A0AAD3XGX0_NEPGR|nr:hypothetical protein Nepgr_005917 [Nepenthes gracilis]